MQFWFSRQKLYQLETNKIWNCNQKLKWVLMYLIFLHIMANFYCSMMIINRSTIIIAFGGKMKINYFLLGAWIIPGTHGNISGLRISFLLYHFISCLFTIFRYLRKNPSASRSNRLNQSSELPPRPQQSSSQSGNKKRHSHRKMKMIDINDEIEKCILYGKETTLWNNVIF